MVCILTSIVDKEYRDVDVPRVYSFISRIYLFSFNNYQCPFISKPNLFCLVHSV